MALNKQSLAINFKSGLDLKTDPLQVSPGRFLRLENSIFTKGGLLQKRNGYGQLTPISDNQSDHLVTFNGGLTAIGSILRDYSEGSATWVDKGALQPATLSVLPAVRSPTNQTQVDSATAANGLSCIVFTDVNDTTTTYKYTIIDSNTGQVIIPSTVIPVTSGTITGSPRIFTLGKYFIIILSMSIASVDRLQYVTINSTNPTIISSNVNISSQYTPSPETAFDGHVVNNTLYLAWNATDVGGAVRVCYITSTLTISSQAVFGGYVATTITVAADTTNQPVLYISFYDSATQDGYTGVLDASLNIITSPVQIITGEDVANLASTAQNSVASVFYEINNTYTYDVAIPTNYIDTVTVTQAGVVGTPSTLIRSVGIASKAFIINDITYFLTIYQSDYQPSYFLCNGSGDVVGKLAYSNAGPYIIAGLPNAVVNDSTVSIPYLFKDLIQGVNKEQGAANTAGVYSQTGINIATFDLLPNTLSSSEIAGGLHLSGGILWFYDGVKPVEDGFLLWPDSVEATAQTASGSMAEQLYYYIATYEWMDAAGNIQRSAPSIPATVTLGTGENQATINIPTLRLTYKIESPVKVVLYRWGLANQTYYQVTSITSPLLNDPTVDYVTFVDTQADATILGNSILYTTGGVIENIAPPATSNVALYKSRLFLIDAEDKNKLWYSKQVIENTPVEMSDLFTIYVAPTIGAQGNTGELKLLAALDDKLILFKKNAIYYLTGNGPDNTGANNDFSEPVFITSTVGSENPNSLVFTPVGLMFQSDKGIWLLGRDLSTSYIGAPVEDFNSATVLSALAIPGTNQVRFTLDNGYTLMYDYYFDQWGTFTNIPALSSTLYNSLHTYINSFGQVYQETPGVYLDGANPVLLSFTTGWLNLAGLQGFERAYYLYLLGTYKTPHKITVQVAYDYNPSPTQATVISPDNYSVAYGVDPLYGGEGNYGGQSTVEQWRVFLNQQKCQAFQLTIKESFDPSFGAVAGAGFTLSGMNIILGIKSSYPRLKPSRSAG